ncbi:hypothetical protein [Terasakiella pusilla]|uniref:hypothetical protein n=1 Tax=Terasakiella pusilla TaxID=64973 RepID=UPI003AA7F4F4
MFSVNRHKIKLATIKPDVCAVILIALFFQIVFPAFALSDPSIQKTTFADDLRQSICFGVQQNSSLSDDHSSNFVCPNCLPSPFGLAMPFITQDEIIHFVSFYPQNLTSSYQNKRVTEKQFTCAQQVPRAPPGGHPSA